MWVGLLLKHRTRPVFSQTIFPKSSKVICTFVYLSNSIGTKYNFPAAAARGDFLLTWSDQLIVRIWKLASPAALHPRIWKTTAYKWSCSVLRSVWWAEHQTELWSGYVKHANVVEEKQWLCCCLWRQLIDQEHDSLVHRLVHVQCCWLLSFRVQMSAAAGMTPAHPGSDTPSSLSQSAIVQKQPQARTHAPHSELTTHSFY